MAKKKSAPLPPKKGTIIAYKGSDEFAGWVKRLAAHVRLPVTNTFDMALKAYAESVGFDESQPKRQMK